MQHPTRNLFFTGKGGVGKTSVACATAVQLADSGKRVLLVSTDPASNLDEVLGVALTSHPTAVPKVPGLWAMNLDPEKAAAEYRERMVGPYRSMLPAAAIASMEEQFSGSCTVEIAAFDEFSKLLGDASATAVYDHLIFDTAPTGHTLRLLALPSAWSGFLEENSTGTSCLGPLSGLEGQKHLYQNTVHVLSNASETTVVLVTRPEVAALKEAARTSHELRNLGVANQQLVVNGSFQATDRSDRVAVALQMRGDDALRSMPTELNLLPRRTIPLSGNAIVGLESLRRFGIEVNDDSSTPQLSSTSKVTEQSTSRPPLFDSLMDDLASHGHGVILAMGKGGVGKTTVAAAIAIDLASRGFAVHLTTTDPASHISDAVTGENLSNLTVTRIDPVVETAKYSAMVLQNAGAGLDAKGQALLEEDLRSPCTEEIAVFRAFADAVAEGTKGFIVLDTAPTGHTVLLLDSALAYHREVTRQSSTMPDSVRQLLPRLRDRELTRVLIVTLPEATPVHEAASLQRDLRRAGIEPFAWVINQCLSPLDIHDPVLCERKKHELFYIAEVERKLSDRTVLIPWQIEPVRGKQALTQLTMKPLIQ